MIGCPVSRVGVLLPTSVLPLPTTAILVLEVCDNARLHRKVACVRLSRPRRCPGSTFPSRGTCLKRKIKQNADGEGRPDWGGSALRIMAASRPVRRAIIG